jgi:hypothetical protein
MLDEMFTMTDLFALLSLAGNLPMRPQEPALGRGHISADISQ